MKRVISLFIVLLNTSCGDFSQDVAFRRQNKSGDVNTDGSLGLYAETGFLPEPGACNKTYSKGYYCDGYTQRNVPLSPASPNPTPETSASTIPPPQAVQLQVVGTFDHARPSVVYIHGWNAEGPQKVYPFPDHWAHQAILAGFNVLAFHWSGLSYDTGAGCPGLGIVGGPNLPCNAAHQLYKAGGAADKFLDAYRVRFTNYSQPVRLVAHSMGSQLAILATYRMHKRGDFEGVKKPTRIDLLDPFMTPGLGGRRDIPFDGQVASDRYLPDDYRRNIVTSFRPGSKCRSWSIGLLWWTISPANHLSHYCQNEGMAYALVKDHNIAMIDFNSILGGVTANDFRKIMLFQSFNSRAFMQHPLSLHVAPVAAYFFSFAPGTPPNGYDASTPDSQILAAARDQAVHNINTNRIQTAGLNTVTLQDDGYR
ncbi:MAG: hypothetical protein FJ146_15840 [Deltaproteobacteria bacterium]|nr:hypothetical protein [Deltaproteobacteria bacterium]